MLFMILCGFVEEKALNLRGLPVIVYPAPCCWVFLGTVNGPSFVRRLVSLSVRQYWGFDPSGSKPPIAGSEVYWLKRQLLSLSLSKYAEEMLRNSSCKRNS